MIGWARAVLAVAAAQEPGATPEAPPISAPEAPPISAPEVPPISAPERGPPRPFVWSGVGVPAINYNAVDRFGVGAGVQLYDRPRGDRFGARYMLTLYTYWTTSGNYTSNYVQLERRGPHPWMARLTYRRWRNMVYVGQGGDAVLVREGPEAYGNGVDGPSLLVNVQRRLPGGPLTLWGQVYARYTASEARAGGPLDRERPFALSGGFYVDGAFGAAIQEVDRFPAPHKGVRAEVSVRAGGTAAEGGFAPLVGVNAEAMGWAPLAGRWLVAGGRLVYDQTWGKRPWWEAENLGGQQRDELAYEQMLTGYARSRTRGDGVFAAMVELRPKLGETHHPVADLAFYVSTFAEVGWLFHGADPGPPLPSLGIAPYVLWQGAVELRPFVSWGWMADVPGGVRTPQAQVGVSLTGAL
jgi:hypothetical protein